MGQADDESVPDSVQAPVKFEDEDDANRNNENIKSYKIDDGGGILLRHSFDSALEGPLE